MTPSLFDFIAFTQIKRDRPLYERDVMNAVCLPDGAVMSLTYRSTWIGIEAGERLRVLSSRLQRWPLLRLFNKNGARLLIVLYEDGGDRILDFLPIRFATIEAIEISEQLGQGLPGRAAVEPGLSIAISLAERPSEELARSMRDVLGACGLPITDRKVSSHLVAVDEPERRLAAYKGLLATTSTWARQVEFLVERSKSLCGKRYWACFGSFRPVWGARVGRAAKQLPGSKTRATTYALQAGATYELECHIHESSIQSWAETPIQVSIAGSHVEVFPASVSQFGPGAVINFLVATQRKFSAEVIGVNFNVVSKKDERVEAVARRAAPEFHCRLEISPSKAFLISTFAILLLSAVLLNITAETLKEVHVNFIDSGGSLLADKVYVTGALMAKGLGGFLVAVGSVLALRKMPIGK